MFTVGKYLAKRYENFLTSSTGAISEQIYVRSSNEPRCLESVQSLLAGLFPPHPQWVWNDELGSVWQPFPIQTVPKPLDSVSFPKTFI